MFTRFSRPRHTAPSARRTAVQVGVAVAVLAGSVVVAVHSATAGTGGLDGVVVAAGAAAVADAAAVDQRTVTRLPDPDRTVVLDGTGAILATFTDGSRSALITGPERTFTEPRYTDAQVRHTGWVRLTPEPWTPGADLEPWFDGWLADALTDTSPDLLDIAMQYVEGAPEDLDEDGLRYTGDAEFGPETDTGYGRLERSDFYDYLGVDWSFADGPDEEAERARYGAVDCSGYVRLVLGYRMGIALRGTNDPGPGLPRRAYAIALHGPGTELIPETGVRSVAYDRLQPGDLVFFNIDTEREIDHMGIYLGVDTDGQHRFVSSRGRANGPTMGDLGGTSLLDDGGYYSESFRTARRV